MEILFYCFVCICAFYGITATFMNPQVRVRRTRPFPDIHFTGITPIRGSLMQYQRNRDPRTVRNIPELMKQRSVRNIPELMKQRSDGSRLFQPQSDATPPRNADKGLLPQLRSRDKGLSPQLRSRDKGLLSQLRSHDLGTLQSRAFDTEILQQQLQDKQMQGLRKNNLVINRNKGNMPKKSSLSGPTGVQNIMIGHSTLTQDINTSAGESTRLLAVQKLPDKLSNQSRLIIYKLPIQRRHRLLKALLNIKNSKERSAAAKIMDRIAHDSTAGANAKLSSVQHNLNLPGRPMSWDFKQNSKSSKSEYFKNAVPDYGRFRWTNTAEINSVSGNEFKSTWSTLPIQLGKHSISPGNDQNIAVLSSKVPHTHNSNLPNTADNTISNNKQPLHISNTAGSIIRNNEQPLHHSNMAGNTIGDNEQPLHLSNTAGSIIRNNEQPLHLSNTAGRIIVNNKQPLHISNTARSIMSNNEKALHISNPARNTIGNNEQPLHISSTDSPQNQIYRQPAKLGVQLKPDVSTGEPYGQTNGDSKVPGVTEVGDISYLGGMRLNTGPNSGSPTENMILLDQGISDRGVDSSDQRSVGANVVDQQSLDTKHPDHINSFSPNQKVENRVFRYRQTTESRQNKLWNANALSNPIWKQNKMSDGNSVNTPPVSNPVEESPSIQSLLNKFAIRPLGGYQNHVANNNIMQPNSILIQNKTADVIKHIDIPIEISYHINVTNQKLLNSIPVLPFNMHTKSNTLYTPNTGALDISTKPAAIGIGKTPQGGGPSRQNTSSPNTIPSFFKNSVIRPLGGYQNNTGKQGSEAETDIEANSRVRNIKPEIPNRFSNNKNSHPVPESTQKKANNVSTDHETPDRNNPLIDTEAFKEFTQIAAEIFGLDPDTVMEFAKSVPSLPSTNTPRVDQIPSNIKALPRNNFNQNLFGSNIFGITNPFDILFPTTVAPPFNSLFNNNILQNNNFNTRNQYMDAALNNDFLTMGLLWAS